MYQHLMQEQTFEFPLTLLKLMVWDRTEHVGKLHKHKQRRLIQQIRTNNTIPKVTNLNWKMIIKIIIKAEDEDTIHDQIKMKLVIIMKKIIRKMVITIVTPIVTIQVT